MHLACLKKTLYYPRFPAMTVLNRFVDSNLAGAQENGIVEHLQIRGSKSVV